MGQGNERTETRRHGIRGRGVLTAPMVSPAYGKMEVQSLRP